MTRKVFVPPGARRVQIPAYTDRWMMGDRYGYVVGPGRPAPSEDELGERGTVMVKLDKSGRVVRVIEEDCT